MTVSIDFDDLTKEEKAAVKQIDKAMKVLSKRHWFFAASSDLNIMRCASDGGRVLSETGANHNGMDQTEIAASISGYNIDGGDW